MKTSGELAIFAVVLASSIAYYYTLYPPYFDVRMDYLRGAAVWGQVWISLSALITAIKYDTAPCKPHCAQTHPPLSQWRLAFCRRHVRAREFASRVLCRFPADEAALRPAHQLSSQRSHTRVDIRLPSLDSAAEGYEESVRERGGRRAWQQRQGWVVAYR